MRVGKNLVTLWPRRSHLGDTPHDQMNDNEYFIFINIFFVRNEFDDFNLVFGYI